MTTDHVVMTYTSKILTQCRLAASIKKIIMCSACVSLMNSNAKPRLASLVSVRFHRCQCSMHLSSNQWFSSVRCRGGTFY